MTKLLPILPAFGVCFAGGMFLHPAPADHTRSLRVLSQLEAPGDDGYAAWKEEAEKAAARRDTQPQQSAEARDLAAKADQIRAIIGEIDTWFRETDPLIRKRDEDAKWVELVRHDSAYKKLCETKEKLEQMILEKDGLKDMPWKDRKAWRKHYEDALKEHDEALGLSLESLKGLRARDPGREGK